MANAMSPTHWNGRGRYREQKIWMSRVVAMPGSGLETLRANAWARLGWAEMMMGNIQAAKSAAAQGIEYGRLSGNDAARAWALVQLGYLDAGNSEFDVAREHLDEALIIARSVGDQPLLQSVHTALGLTLAWNNDFEGALSHYEEVAAILQELGDPWVLAILQIDLANALRKLGQTEESARVFREALRRQREFGDEEYLWVSANDAATVAATMGKHEQAATLLGFAAGVRERNGYSVNKFDLGDYASTVDAAKRELGDVRFAAAWSQGESLSLEDAVAIADQVIAEWGEWASAPKEPSRNAYGLSQRELEVLRLLAMGRSNRAIGEELFISVPTVKVHVRSVLTKLGVESRTAAAAFGIQNRLI
jgi:ATP/maltotriose-dependent transcriptional regulator MalT